METGDNTQNQAPTPAPQAPQTGGPTPPPDNTTLMGILSYISILVIIPYLTSRDNAFVKFHIKQGIVLAVAEIALYVIGMSLYMLAPILGIVNLGLLVLSILGIVNVINKKEAEVPLLGQFAKHVNI